MDKNWLQQRDWDVYLALEGSQRRALWAFLGLLGLVFVALSRGDGVVDFSGGKLPAQVILATAPFFVFFMGGQFYFLSAYLVLAYGRVIQAVAAANEDVPFRDICRRLVMPDIATALNLYAPNVPHREAATSPQWLFLVRLTFLSTKALALTPFLVHIGFTVWFYLKSAQPGILEVGPFARTLVLVMYLVFFVSAIVMCEYLRRITASVRDAIRIGLASET
jgi:hypothetical protein